MLCYHTKVFRINLGVRFMLTHRNDNLQNYSNIIICNVQSAIVLREWSSSTSLVTGLLLWSAPFFLIKDARDWHRGLISSYTAMLQWWHSLAELILFQWWKNAEGRKKKTQSLLAYIGASSTFFRLHKNLLRQRIQPLLVYPWTVYHKAAALYELSKLFLFVI